MLTINFSIIVKTESNVFMYCRVTAKDQMTRKPNAEELALMLRCSRHSLRSGNIQSSIFNFQ